MVPKISEYAMKKFFFIPLLILAFIQLSCSSNIPNEVIFKNFASGTIYINFLGEVLTLTTGTTKVFKDVQRGTYSYETSYEVPAAATGSSVEGAVSGDITLNPGTKVQVLYTSRLQGTGTQLNYILSATISSNDKITTEGTTSP